MDDLLGEPGLGCFSSGRQLWGHLELTGSSVVWRARWGCVHHRPYPLPGLELDAELCNFGAVTHIP